MSKVNQDTTYVFVGEGGRYEVYCRTRLIERGRCDQQEAARTEAIECARRYAKAAGHALIKVRDLNFDNGCVHSVPTRTPEEIEAERRRKIAARIREWHQQNQKRCGMCYVPLKTQEEKDTFLCSAHRVPAPDDVREDLMAHAELGVVGEGIRVVQGYEQECEAAAWRARTAWEQGKRYW